MRPVPDNSELHKYLFRQSGNSRTPASADQNFSPYASLTDFTVSLKIHPYNFIIKCRSLSLLILKEKDSGILFPIIPFYAFPVFLLETTSKITAARSTTPFTTYCH